ncbi:hypothetical protein NBCG_00835 [Nocardioidaceae bacterium Broad-1]|uniref:type IV toxin-antitoxin system AbiEi family antitoxin n=1 Tax=Nocardioides luteus TaxID=1844 RepID=UPI00020295F1|nr:type IV toxin-antitoxin system AbiEi family antitoxin [Nocardioides luteus]EGD44741.1 hypothetical protein NBCG_00835 [Nocardioidaceae bacterium Broad-1]MBG6099085.1 hypothetical protein [Nocardioides luteus]
MTNVSALESRLHDMGVTTETRLSKRLAGYGVREWTLARGNSSKTYALVSGGASNLSLPAVASLIDMGLPLLVWDDYVHDELQSTFRRAGIQYVDLAGNAWIEFGDVLISISGREASRSKGSGDRKTTRKPSEARGVNPFSANRNQVIFALLSWPDLWDASSRTLAEVSGVSVGLAHETAALLKESGLAAKSTRYRPGGLLDRWANGFSDVTVPRLGVWHFYGNTDVDRIKSIGPVYVSGEAAAQDLLRPTELIVYTSDLRPDPDKPSLPVLNRWRRDAPASAAAPNVIVRQQFWTPREDLDDDARLVREAPWPLVYADLLASKDPRVQEVAQDWRSSHV